MSGHFCHRDVWKESEPLNGPRVQALCRWAREFDIFVSAGIAERVGSVLYNSHLVIGPNGIIGKQCKLHMSRDEYFYFRGGTEFSVIDIGKAKLGIVICYDIMHPETARVLALKGAEVLLFPHAARVGAWKDVRRKQAQVVRQSQDLMKMVCACRYYDNVVFGVYNNQSGDAAPHRKEPVAVHAGGILLHDPAGKLLAESRSHRLGAEEMVVATFRAADRESVLPDARFTQRGAELFRPLIEG